MTHFKEQKAYTKPQEVSRNLKFVTNKTTNVCFDFGGRISRFLPMLVGGHEKIDGTIQKILPSSLEFICILEFVVINTSNGFSSIEFDQTLDILNPKKVLFSLNRPISGRHDNDVILLHVS